MLSSELVEAGKCNLIKIQQFKLGQILYLKYKIVLDLEGCIFEGSIYDLSMDSLAPEYLATLGQPCVTSSVPRNLMTFSFGQPEVVELYLICVAMVSSVVTCWQISGPLK